MPASESRFSDDRVRRLDRVISAMSAAARLDLLEAALGAAVEALFPEETVRLCLAEGGSIRRQCLTGRSVEGPIPSRHAAAEQVIRTGEPVLIDLGDGAIFQGPRGALVRSIVAAPLRASGRPVGAIEVLSQGRFGTVDLHVAAMLAAQFAVTRELILSRQELEATRTRAEENQRRSLELNEQLLELANTDPLTGLLNKRRLLEQLDIEVGRARRYGEALSCLMLDVDHFKEINDSLGHPAGDDVLRQVARVLRRSVRVTDFVARYGGEEFAILLPRTDERGALKAAEALRATLEGHGFAVPERQLRVTASIGIASQTEFDGAGSARLLEQADRALYSAKRAGRNRVSGWHLQPEE